MEYPKISIITPSYNRGKFIEQTILSILDQGYPNLEYIIIDGGSTDETVEIIRKYENRLSYWISEKDNGQSDAINKGFIRATGEVINWINSDDYMEPGSLAKIAESFRDPKINAVTTVVRNFIEGSIAWHEQTSIMSSATNYIAKGFNNQPGTFFRKSVWDRYFPLPKQFRYTMDQYLWFCYWMENSIENFKIEQYSTVNFRRHSESKTSSSLEDEIFNKLGKVFFNEHNLLFWSYFIPLSEEKAKVLETYFYPGYDYQNAIMRFDSKMSTVTEVNETLYNSYLIELLKEDYRHGNFKRLEENLHHCSIRFLEPVDIAILKSLKKKLRFRGLINIYRAIYWNFRKLFK